MVPDTWVIAAKQSVDCHKQERAIRIPNKSVLFNTKTTKKGPIRHKITCTIGPFAPLTSYDCAPSPDFVINRGYSNSFFGVPSPKKITSAPPPKKQMNAASHKRSNVGEGGFSNPTSEKKIARRITPTAIPMRPTTSNFCFMSISLNGVQSTVGCSFKPLWDRNQRAIAQHIAL